MIFAITLWSLIVHFLPRWSYPFKVPRSMWSRSKVRLSMIQKVQKKVVLEMKWFFDNKRYGDGTYATSWNDVVVFLLMLLAKQSRFKMKNEEYERKNGKWLLGLDLRSSVSLLVLFESLCAASNSSDFNILQLRKTRTYREYFVFYLKRNKQPRLRQPNFIIIIIFLSVSREFQFSKNFSSLFFI